MLRNIQLTMPFSPDVFFRLIEDHAPDVLCLQETRLQESHIDSFHGLIPGYVPYWSCSKTRKGYSGTAVLIRKASVIQSPQKTCGWEGSKGFQMNMIDGVVGVDDIKGDKKLNVLDVKINSSKGSFSEEGRIITVEFDQFYLINCYAPNTALERPNLEINKVEWDRYIVSYLNELRLRKPVILAADLNCGYHPLDIYDFERIIRLQKRRPNEQSFLSIILENRFFDAFRHFYPGKRKSVNLLTHSARRGKRPVYILVCQGCCERGEPRHAFGLLHMFR